MTTPERVLCVDPHDYGPTTTTEWIPWAKAREKTHELHQCPDCRLLVIWRPRAEQRPEPEQQALL